MKQRMTMTRNGQRYRLVQYYFGYVVETEDTAKHSDTRPYTPYTPAARELLAAWLKGLGYTVINSEPADSPVIIGHDLASGPDYSVLVCSGCCTPLRPDHRNGERCPSCGVAIVITV